MKVMREREAGKANSGQTEKGLKNIVNTRFYPKSNGKRPKKLNQQSSMIISECLN